MFRLIAVTLAALYAVLYVFGDETRRPDAVARAEPLSLGFSNPRAFFLDVENDTHYVSEISDADAVERAVAAAHAYRSTQSETQLTAVAAKVADQPADTATAEASTPAFWYVTGSRVNLRGGPGTSNPVVGQVTLGMEAEVLSDRDGWYEIRLANGSGTGWISGKFLGQQRPG
jgi:hypothetical protein